jgi:hypothetical protein
MTPTKFNMGTKNADFDADNKSIEKVAKKWLTWKKLEGRELLDKVLKDEAKRSRNGSKNVQALED